MSPPFSGSTNKLFLLPASRCILAWRILRHWRRRRHFPPKRRLTFNWLLGVIFQKIELFMATAVKNSNLYKFTHFDRSVENGFLSLRSPTNAMRDSAYISRYIKPKCLLLIHALLDKPVPQKLTEREFQFMRKRTRILSMYTWQFVYISNLFYEPQLST
jgi:hypothetical protein